MTLQLRKLVVGPLQVNCYLLTEPTAKEALLIDPGAEPDRILDWLSTPEVRVSAIVLTHSHGDHIGAVGELKANTGAPILMHRAEAEWITDPERNLSALFGIPVRSPSADRLLEDQDTLAVGAETLRVLHTPGHSPGGLSLYQEGMLICGDLLFRQSIGRHDLPGGDLEALRHSIMTRVFSLPDNTLVHPGHGEVTTVGYEKKHNPFITQLSAVGG